MPINIYSVILALHPHKNPSKIAFSCIFATFLQVWQRVSKRSMIDWFSLDPSSWDLCYLLSLLFWWSKSPIIFIFLPSPLPVWISNVSRFCGVSKLGGKYFSICFIFHGIYFCWKHTFKNYMIHFFGNFCLTLKRKHQSMQYL